MSPDDDSPGTERIEARLQDVDHYVRLVRAGLAAIIGAFLLSVVALLPINLDSVASAVDAVLLPLILVGMGLLLFGIGMHPHLVHLNPVRQLRKEPDGDSKSSEEG